MAKRVSFEGAVTIAAIATSPRGLRIARRLTDGKLQFGPHAYTDDDGGSFRQVGGGIVCDLSEIEALVAAVKENPKNNLVDLAAIKRPPSEEQANVTPKAPKKANGNGGGLTKADVAETVVETLKSLGLVKAQS